jgi:hypothetical protein
MKLYSIAILAALAMSLVGAGGAAARSSAVHTSTVRAKATDFHFAMSTKTVRHGRVTFVIRTASSALHNFVIAGHRSKTIGLAGRRA